MMAANTHTVCATLVVVAGLIFGTACSVSVDGTFDGIAFAPTTSSMAILDQHEVLIRDGAFIPVEKSRAQLDVALLLTSADVPMQEEWRRLAPERYLDVKAALAQSDILLLEAIDFDALQDGDLLTATNTFGDLTRPDRGDASGDGDFRFALGQRADGDIGLGLGALVEVQIEAQKLEREDVRGGHLDAVITITRERAAGQPEADIRTGEVTLTVSLPLAPERLSKANLAIGGPIARCKAVLGPDAGLACSDTPSDAVVDATGEHR